MVDLILEFGERASDWFFFEGGKVGEKLPSQ